MNTYLMCYIFYLCSFLHGCVQPEVLETMVVLSLYGCAESAVVRGTNLLQEYIGEVRGHEEEGGPAPLSPSLTFL